MSRHLRDKLWLHSRDTVCYGESFNALMKLLRKLGIARNTMWTIHGDPERTFEWTEWKR